MIYLNEDTRAQLINASKSAGQYKDQSRGKNRFERKRYSKVANQVKSYNSIDMNKFIKQDILEFNVPVIGEHDNYEVTLRLEGVMAQLQKNIKSNHNNFDYKAVVQAIVKVFTTSNVFIKCTCQDFRYRFEHWSIINNWGTDDTSKDPGPGKGIANPNNNKGKGCKHCLLVLANQSWIMKVSSTIQNYINYLAEKKTALFLKVVFEKLYGIPADEAEQNDLVPADTDLKSTKDVIDLINDYGKNRGKYKKGSNVNPVQADKLEKEQKAEKAAKQPAKPEPTKVELTTDKEKDKK